MAERYELGKGRFVIFTNPTEAGDRLKNGEGEVMQTHAAGPERSSYRELMEERATSSGYSAGERLVQHLEGQHTDPDLLSFALDGAMRAIIERLRTYPNEADDIVTTEE